MSFTQTPNYSLYKPTINADNDQWGTHLNANADTLDATLQTISNTATGAAVTISDTAPATPAVGALWFDSVGTQMYLRYNDGNSSQWVPATNQNVAIAPQTQTNVGRNLIHNPMFNVAQRGVGPFTTQNGVWTLDRWNLYTATDTVSLTQVPANDATRTQIGDEAAQFLLGNTFTGSAAAAAFQILYQSIESVRRLAGKTVTVSFWAAAGTGLKLGISLQQGFGTGGSPSASVNVAAQSVTLATTYARYSLTFVIPSASGKTLGTNGNDCTVLQFCYSSGTTNAAIYGNPGVQSGSVWLWGVQLEVGSVATPLEHIDPGLDLRNCQRFYATTFVQIDTYQLAGSAVSATAFFPATMRATPTIALLGGGSLTNLASVSAWIIGPSSGSLRGAATATGGTGFAQYISASADL